MYNIQEFKDSLAKEVYGMTQSEAKERGICMSCKEPALPKCYSEAGRREFQISGLCEICFDDLFEVEEDEEEVEEEED